MPISFLNFTATNHCRLRSRWTLSRNKHQDQPIMEPTLDTLRPLATALAIGLLIGIERGWKGRHEEEGDRTGGIRTFSLIGLLGGVGGLLAQEVSEWILAMAFLSVSALAIVAHILDVRQDKDVGATTAFAMMLTFVLSAWAVFGNEISALSATVIVAALLSYKPVLHNWLKNVKKKEIFAGIKLLIISVVLLPLLPDEGFGPWQALNPYWIWWMVVIISGLSFAGYVAIKLAGRRLGVLLTAITGGLASSTAVTLSLAQFARKSHSKIIFIAGVLFASSIMFIRVLVEVSVVNASLLGPLWVPLLAMFGGMLLLGGWLVFQEQRGTATSETSIELKNPFQLGMALKFGALLGLMLVLSEGVQEWYGDGGIYALSVASGLMDVDAITLSLSRMAKDELAAEVATMGIVLASATNTLVKGAIFTFIAGWKAGLRLTAYLALAIIPGLVLAFVL